MSLKMTKYDELPERIKIQLQEITRSSGLPEGQDSLELIATNWIEKRKLFEEQTKTLDMKTVDSLGKDYSGGALMLTYSGSLVALGTLLEGSRWVEYASIKLRADVPGIVKRDNVRVINDIQVADCVEFENGPVKKTSEILVIACCAPTVNLVEQEKRIREATIFLTDGFVKLNRALTMNTKNSKYEQFDMKSIVSYIARDNDLTQTQVSRIIEDYLYILECGLLLGERVSLGKLGSARLKVRQAQKARVGRNPATGEQMTIKAKPATPVPRINFSNYIKDKAAGLDLNQLEHPEG